ncbi:putative small protein [Roseovarius mucosus DSM 17069]|uniref:Putative small protein n=1 Tax=Roseovarius mucosus DSM 17069 TaxID=1288298 RepID=A0A0A0HHU8_9RHOB|nr:YdcH family protein [Roseovarius mucosus]KGM86536.1 putative small protein [Roseovarius mucosus DSM 17069]
MTPRRISPQSLLSRIATLRRRHQDIDARITTEHQRPMPDMAMLKRLKQERLGLKDAIHVTRMMLGRIQPDTVRTG